MLILPFLLRRLRFKQMSFQFDSSFSRFTDSRQYFQKRCSPTAVRPMDSDEIARFDFKTDALRSAETNQQF